MDGALLVTLAAGAALLAMVLVVLLLVVSGRRRMEKELVTSRAEIAVLHERLDRLSRQAERSAVPPAEFVITDVGRAQADRALMPAPLSSRQFASVALGESLVRVFSFGYGVRRALSAQSRNRIVFEMRSEVRRARKQRRRDLREAKRTLRADPSRAAGEDAA